MEAVLLLRTGWTYGEYLDVPDHLIRMILAILNAEAEWAKSRQVDQQRIGEQCQKAIYV